MNVGVDTTGLQTPHSGICRYLVSLLDELQQIDKNNNYYIFERSQSSYALTNARWHRVVAASRLPTTVWFQTAMPRLLRMYSIDVFWCPRQFCPLLAPGTVRVVTSLYDFVFRRYPGTMDGLSALLYGLQVPLSLRKSALVVADSDAICEEALATYRWLSPQKMAVVTPGVDLRHLRVPRTTTTGRGQHLLFVGNLEPRKNISGLLDALEILLGRGACPTLRMVGPPGWRNRRLLNRITAGPLHAAIELRGYLTDGQLADEYARCRALVFPSFYEGFGLPVLEALAHGCMVLTSRSTVMQEVAGPAALYFDPRDPADIAEKIARIYTAGFDDDLYLRHAPEIVTKYTWERSAQRLLEVFELAVSRG